MASPVKHAGWPGADAMTQPAGESSIDAKRRTRQLTRNASMPTPPRTRLQTGLPTPSSTHRSKPKPAPSTAAPTTSLYPTPDTVRVRRSPRLSRQGAAGDTSSAAQDAKAENHASVQLTPPSPTGHTTFYLAHAQATLTAAGGRSKDEPSVRRRAGLTFNQQMGLGATTQTGSGPSGRQGAGVGMGGRGRLGAGHGRVDRITWNKLHPTSTTLDNDNPFIASAPQLQEAAPIASPGTFTSHRPRNGLEEDDAEADDTHHSATTSPLRSDRFRPSPRKHMAPPVPTNTALLSPPPTQSTQRTLSFAPTHPSAARLAAAEKRCAAKERMKAAMDEENNVFLAQPGEVRHPGPVVDERGPYVDYVFRGARKTFANPFVALSGPFPESELHPSHPEFEAHPLPRPKLLWPVGPSKPMRKSPAPTPGMASDDENAEGVSPPSSPPAVTPRGPSSRQARRTFIGRVRSSGEDELKGPPGLFSPHEDIMGEHADQDDAEATDHEPDLQVRRGLLFGPGGMGGRKRVTAEPEERAEIGTTTPRRSKKAKALRL